MLQATLELLDKWGKHYEMHGAAPDSGGGKIAQTWRELMKVGLTMKGIGGMGLEAKSS